MFTTQYVHYTVTNNISCATHRGSGHPSGQGSRLPSFR